MIRWCWQKAVTIWKVLHRGPQRQFRLVLRFGLITFAVSAGYAIAILIELKAYLWSGVGFLILLGATLGEFVFGDVLAERRYPYQTEKKLQTLEDRLGAKVVAQAREKIGRTIATLKACDTGSVSGTVHLIVDLQPSAESPVRRGLMQLTDYVGARTGGKGRITPLEKGVIGRCARTGAAEFVNFASEEEYFSRMVREFGFSESETRTHSKTARSYLAHPLRSDGVVIGVLYLFTTEPQVFPYAADATHLSGVAEDLVGLLKVVALI
jgi:hypothetical protein